MPHPATLIFLWGCLALAMQSLQAAALLLAGLPLLAVACLRSTDRLFALVRRTRWIMLSLLLIYSYATPGEAVWVSLAQFSPTHEGLNDGLLQLCRLLFMLAGLSVLLNLLPQPRLISGLYALCYPLRYVGLSRERLAVRLALTLHYAESAMLDVSGNWRDRIGKMVAAENSQRCGGHSADTPLAGAAAAAEQHGIELHDPPFTRQDRLLLVMGCAALMLALP
ncbi:MAG: hypothetical protein HZC43_12760 [Nitrosomonadales bacterium]|nr:hypothetical protein [Nitrosomonadales bacterium]